MRKNKCDGVMCKHGNNDCGEPSKNNYFECTLPVGHDGPHIACGYAIHNTFIWENKNETNPTNDTTDVHG